MEMSVSEARCLVGGMSIAMVAIGSRMISGSGKSSLISNLAAGFLAGVGVYTLAILTLQGRVGNTREFWRKIQVGVVFSAAAALVWTIAAAGVNIYARQITTF